MSHLVGLDEVLDLVSDVKEIDQIVHSDPQDGLITLIMLCGSEAHSKLLVTDIDLAELQRILSGTVMFRHQ